MLRGEPLETRHLLTTFTVSSTLDEPLDPTPDGILTLREALEAANTDAPFGDALIGGSGEDEIILTGTGTLSLTAGQLRIKEGVSIRGPGMDLLTIDANEQSRFAYMHYQEFAPGDHNVAIEGLTITGGSASSGGGIGVRFDGGSIDLNMTLDGLRLIDNESTSDNGGAVSFNSRFNDSRLTVRDSIITGNESSTSVGGLYANFYRSYFQDYPPGTSLTISNTAIDDNTAAVAAGGIGVIAHRASVEIVNSTISINEAGGRGGGAVIFERYGSLLIDKTSIIGNKALNGSAGGIFVEAQGNPGGATALITNSTIAGNTAYSGPAENAGKGGGLFGYVENSSVLRLDNTTISGNTGETAGGGIYLDVQYNPSFQATYGVHVLQNVTITQNKSPIGGGLHGHVDGESIVLLTNSIVSGNFLLNGTSPSNVAEDLNQASSYNLIGTGGNGGLVNGQKGNIVGVNNPGLGVLSTNGGPTLTHLPSAGSPAINMGNPSISQSPNSFDQRGSGFPRVTVGRIDIGAVERDGSVTPTPQAVGLADIVLIVDESGSTNANEQFWLPGFVLDLEAELREAGYTSNRFGLVGFGRSAFSEEFAYSRLLNGKLMGSAIEASVAAASMLRTGGTEDGWDGMEHAVAEYDFRPGAAVHFVLITNEERDNYNTSLTPDGFTSDPDGPANMPTAIAPILSSRDAVITTIVNAAFEPDNSGDIVLGVKNSGAPNHDSVEFNPSTQSLRPGTHFHEDQDNYNDLFSEENAYIRFAWDTGGSAWNDNVIRDHSPTSEIVETFTEQLVSAIASTIVSQEVYEPSGVILAYNFGGPTNSFFPENEPSGLGGSAISATEDIDTNSSSIPFGTQSVFETAREFANSTNLNLALGSSAGIANGTYTVELYFAEIDSSDDRIFDVALEGITVLNNYRISEDFAKIEGQTTGFDLDLESSEAGFNTGLVKTYEVVVSDGTLNIALNDAGGTQGPVISGLRILELGLAPALLGDYNNDGSVDAADYTVWRNNLGSPVATAFQGADGNGNRVIDQEDYSVWKSNYGNVLINALALFDALPGDYNNDGSVDAADYTVWRDNEGAIVTPYSGADASGNGVVDQADYIIWKTNYGETTESFHDPSVLADYDRDGEVGQGDYDKWEATLGSTVDLSADGNRNGVVDMADLDVWQEYRNVTVADTVAGDYNNNGVVDVADYNLWKDTYGSTTNLSADGNDDGVVDAADYTIWRNNLGMTTAAVWPTILGESTGMPFEVPDMAPQVVGFSLSGSNSAHPTFDFDSVVGSGEQLRSVPVGGIDTLTITFSEEVFVLNSDLTLTNLEGTTLPAVESFSYDLDSHSAIWEFASVLPVGRYLVQLSDDVIDLDQDSLDGEFTNPWSLAEAAGYASEFPSGDGEAGGEFRFRFVNLAADYNGNNIVEGTDDDVWFSNYNQSGKTSTRQGDGDGNGTVAYTNDLVLYYSQYGKNYTAWPSIEPGMVMVSTLVDENDGNHSLGDLSLREAIALAGATADDETIVFAPGLTGTMYINSILSIGSTFQGNLIVDGPGADQLTLDASSSSNGTFDVAWGSPIDEFILRDMRLTSSTAAVFSTADDAHVVLERMDISDNWGTSVYVYGAHLSIYDSEFAGNQSTNVIEFWGNGTGHLTIGNSSILDNYGMGLLVYGGSANVFNSTFSGNYISDPVGGIWAQGADVTITNSTITNNEGESTGGILVSHGGNVTLHNSIVVGNRVFGSPVDIYSPGYQGGTFDSSSSHNLIGVDGTSSTTFPSGSNDNQVGVTTTDLKLSPLGYYGGPTRTHMLLEDSVAIDAGNNQQALDSAGNMLMVDQRGLARITGAAIDIGGVEGSSGSHLTVGTLTDENDSNHSPGDFSLREAMDLASDLYGVETIEFDPSLSGTLTLSLGQLTIDTDLEIAGPGADVLTISGNNASRVFYQSYFNPVTTAAIRDLRIAEGSASTSSGGGISSFGELTLERVAIEDNHAATGGGIFSSGTLTMINSTVADNTAAYIGGGVQLGSADAPATIMNTTISSNSSYYGGGGLYVNWSPVMLAHSTITQNRSTGGSYGGGIAIYSSNVILHHSIVADNYGSGSNESDIVGALDTAFSRYNLIGTGGSGGISNGVNGNLVGVTNPGLTTLGYHGGSLRTHALLQGSLAIDAGDTAISGAPLKDQRGEDRIIDWLDDDPEATIDIGAVELAVDEIYS